MRFQIVELALISGAHGAPRTIHHSADVLPGLAPQLGELGKSRLENSLQRTCAFTRIDRALIQLVQIAAGPEILLKAVSLVCGAPESEYLDEDVVPRKQRR